MTPPPSATLPAGATSVSVPVQTRSTTTLASNPVVTITIAAGSGYSVGSPASASTTIENTNVSSPQHHRWRHRVAGRLDDPDRDGQPGAPPEPPGRAQRLGQCHPGHRLRPRRSHPDHRRRDHLGECHRRHHREHRHPAEQVHRRLHRPLRPTAYTVGRPGLGGHHHQREHALADGDPDLVHHLSAEGPALRGLRRAERSGQHASHRPADLSGYRPARHRLHRPERKHRRAGRPDLATRWRSRR